MMSCDSTALNQNITDVLTNAGNGTADPLSVYWTWLYDTERWIEFYTTIIIAPFGIAGNCFSIAVFCSSPNLRGLSTIQFLIALAITDSLYLIGELFFVVSDTDLYGCPLTRITFARTRDVGCKTVMWLRYSTKMMSAWITVMITLERLLAVALPLRVSSLSTPFRARVLTILMCILCVPLTCFPLWTVGTILSGEVLRCEFLNEFVDIYRKWVFATNIIGSLSIPSTLLIVFTAIIFVFLGRSRHLRHTSAHAGGGHLPNQTSMSLTQRSGRHSNQSQQLQRQHSSSSTNNQLMLMLITVSVTALILQVPYIICYFLKESKNEEGTNVDHNFHARINFALSITQVLSTTNYAINFLLYCVSGSTFRGRIVELFSGCCRSCQRRNQFEVRDTVQTMSTSASTQRTSRV